ncbi:phosphoribosylamine--glycine ligase [Planctellipticum variicoloris]|uniref:phosphoribosylamine--glycine ligase n=1 Tax=Planctellipticum variicoloris TaxID=3064265 RepID=UPI003013327D|nr:phosphoribosylamine--glycine ligase [Planctomycetaceae bacterium SH412]
MKVLVLGSGGREHALVWKLKQSPSVTQVFCAPGNAGIGLDAVNVDISSTDTARLLKFVAKEQIDLTVVGPEIPLVAGVVDEFLNAGHKIFGPTSKAAELEGSKRFSKELMKRANVPTADFSSFTNAAEANSYLDEREIERCVVKADGLAAGKGVVVCSSREEARDTIKRMLIMKEFGAAGARIVIEERLVGEEASLLALVDGKTIVPLEAAQDHKAAFDGDTGPNTGGMGAYCPTPIMTPDLIDLAVEKVLVPVVHQLKKEGRPFRGCLYAGLMLTSQGPKVLEFNVRFGDPETQAVLMRLKSDLGLALMAAATGTLEDMPPLEWDPRPSVCVVMASAGYPGEYQKGKAIRGLDDAAQIEDAKVFHAGTVRGEDGQILTDGGRVLGVTALGDTISQAKLRAYQTVKCIRWEGAWCRKDISDKAIR